MVLSTALFDKPAFKNLVCNGLVLAADGKKMSKRLKNYPVSEGRCFRRCIRSAPMWLPATACDCSKPLQSSASPRCVV